MKTNLKRRLKEKLSDKDTTEKVRERKEGSKEGRISSEIHHVGCDRSTALIKISLPSSLPRPLPPPLLSLLPPPLLPSPQFNLDAVTYASFVQNHGYGTPVSAADVVHSVTALLECGAMEDMGESIQSQMGMTASLDAVRRFSLDMSLNVAYLMPHASGRMPHASYLMPHASCRMPYVLRVYCTVYLC